MVRRRLPHMSEQEWLECDNSEVMLEFVRSKASKRKLQLFAGACFRRLVYLLPDQRQLKAIEALENVSEGAELPPGVGNRVRSALPSSEDSLGGKCKDTDDPYFVALMLFREFQSSSTAHHATYAARGLADGGVAERVEQSRLLRCIFGPLPFHTVSITPSWATPAVLALAQSIYEEQAFAKLPMLGDALERSGLRRGQDFRSLPAAGLACSGLLGRRSPSSLNFAAR